MRSSLESTHLVSAYFILISSLLNGITDHFQHYFAFIHTWFTAVDLMEKLLVFDPKERLTASQAIAHPHMATFHNPSDEVRPMASSLLVFFFA
jgi:hypothetical protein